MPPSDPLMHPVARDFLRRYFEDRTRGRFGLADYQKEWPGHPEIIAAAFAEIAAQNDSALACTNDADSEPPTHGRYVLREEIGRGGFSTVRRGRDVALGRDVAVKIHRRREDGDAAALERFAREACILAALRIPGVCTIYDARVQDGGAFLVMEAVEGRTLAELLAEDRTLGDSGSSRYQADRIRHAVELLRDCATTMQSVHDAGIVHRDLSPRNIMVTPERRPVIIDFGLAHEDGGERLLVTQTGEILGTPAYMAPEQVRGERPITPAADIWALGAILYEALTLEHPFVAATRDDLFAAIQHQDFASPRRRIPAVPRDLETILATALAKEPGRRYRTAQHFADDLDRFLRDESIQARPEPLRRRLARRIRRNRPLAVTSAILLLVIVGASLTTAILSSLASSRLEAQLAAERHRDLAESTGLAAQGVHLIQSGLTDAGIAQLTRAATLPGTDNVAIQLQIASARLGAMDPTLAHPILEDLLNRGVPAQHRRSLAVLCAEAAASGSFAGSTRREWAERARNDGEASLSTAEVAWAEALAAESIAELEVAVAACLEANGSYRSAQRMSVVLELLRGRHEAGLFRARTYRQVFGSEPALVATEVYCAAMLRRDAEARSLLESLRERYTPMDWKFCETFLNLATAARDLDDSLCASMVPTTDIDGRPASSDAALAAVGETITLFVTLARSEPYRAFTLPLREVAESPSSTHDRVLPWPGSALQNESLLQLLPDAGPVRFLEGLSASSTGRWMEAHEALMAAQRTSRFLVLERATGLHLMSNFLGALAAWRNDRERLAPLRPGLLATVKALLGNPRARAPELLVASLAACLADDATLGERCAARAQELAPGDPYIDRWLGTARYRQGAYGPALLHLDRFLAQVLPPRERETVTELRDHCEALLGRIGPPHASIDIPTLRARRR